MNCLRFIGYTRRTIVRIIARCSFLRIYLTSTWRCGRGLISSPASAGSATSIGIAAANTSIAVTRSMAPQTFGISLGDSSTANSSKGSQVQQGKRS